MTAASAARTSQLLASVRSATPELGASSPRAASAAWTTSGRWRGRATQPPILGRALYEGVFSLAEVIAAAR